LVLLLGCRKPIEDRSAHELALAQEGGVQGLRDANVLESTRLPSGAPEACIEAFANIYREAARAIRVEVNGDLIPEDLDFPTVDDVNHGGKLVEDTIEFAANSIPPVRIGETVRVYAVALEA
jgi:hypothetical protein